MALLIRKIRVISQTTVIAIKEYTYKELPKTGVSTTNSAAIGILMIITGTVLTFVRKFRKIQK